MNNLETPLILVFYIDATMMENRDVIQPFVESVNSMIERKNANVMAFFIPTVENERIECISHVPEHLKTNIEELVKDIKNNFNY